MLALRTGWTPQVIGGEAEGGITDDVRRALHFALFAEVLAPLYDDAREALAIKPARGLPPDAFAELSRIRLAASTEIAKLRGLLKLEDAEDDDG